MSDHAHDDRDPAALLEHLLVPVASPEDARTTARSLRRHVPSTSRVTVVHVVEKAGGAVDKASVEQREREALEAFEAFREVIGDSLTIDTDILYGTDIADTVFAAADDVGASAIAFTPRGGSRWVRLLTGDVALDLVTETDRPVLVLPEAPGDGDSEDG